MTTSLWLDSRVKHNTSLRAYKIDVNTASAAQFAQLPGWGISLGESLVKSRQKSGPFESPERLLRVPGVSVRLLNRARPYIRVGEASRVEAEDE